MTDAEIDNPPPTPAPSAPAEPPATAPSSTDGKVSDAATASDLVHVDETMPQTLMVFPLRRAVAFPGLVMPVVAEGATREIFEKAKAQGPHLALVAVKDLAADPLRADSMYSFGVLARVHRVMTLPNGNQTAISGGLRRLKVERWVRLAPYPIAKVSYPEEVNPGGPEVAAHMRAIPSLLKQIASKDPNLEEDLAAAALNLDNPGNLADFAAAYFVRDVADRERALEMLDVRARLRFVHEVLTRDNELLELSKRLQSEIREKIEKQQKQFFLREQLKILRRELGEEKDTTSRDRDDYEAKIAAAKMPETAEAKAREELERLKVIPTESAEYSVVRTYLDWLTSLPWSKSSKEQSDPAVAERVLEQDHYGLDEVKERIVEFIGVRKLRPDRAGPILCLVGPPGVGKTSLGLSIARATGRPFVHSALGGMRDEAEIRGHRRTYVGAMPGRVIQEVRNAKVNNPVFLLDEIDKLGSDFRGDPSSALLEVLDPEQNRRFIDHYLDVPFDLSRILFVTTANSLDTIPPALRDRLEVIEIPGYVTEEKVAIARRYLLPRQRENHGLTRRDLDLPVTTVRAIIEGYTREAGVRRLEKAIEKIARRRALAKARRTSKSKPIPAQVRVADLEKFLGPPRFVEERDRTAKGPGVATGLAWTGVGGDVLSIEVARWPGKGGLQLTGQLGDVMTESARIALSYLRANAARFGVRANELDSFDLHVHFPAGATPKDGPSAGITIATAILSLLRNEPVRRGLAMTGELTLTGEVLPIGGVREKVLVAKRYGIHHVVLPELNRADVRELKPQLVRGMHFEYVKRYADVAPIAFARLSRETAKSKMNGSAARAARAT